MLQTLDIKNKMETTFMTFAKGHLKIDLADSKLIQDG